MSGFTPPDLLRDPESEVGGSVEPSRGICLPIFGDGCGDAVLRKDTNMSRFAEG